MRREERSDTDLVVAARGDDPDAFGVLFDRWFDRAWNVARTIVRQDDLAADVAQDALLAAWQGLGQLEDPGAFGGWVLRITRNRALNRLAREQRSTASGDDVVSGLRDRGLNDPVGAAPLPAPDVVSEAHDQQELVWAAAAALGERDLSLLDLQLRHGLSPAEIAQEMGVASNAAHQQLFRLRDKLGEAVGSYLLWRNGRPLCDGLATAVSGEKAFNRSVARSVVRHQASCEHCSDERAALVDPGRLFAAVPLVLVPAHFKIQAAAALQAAGVPTGAAASGAGGSSHDGGAGSSGGRDGGAGSDGGGSSGGGSTGSDGGSDGGGGSGPQGGGDGTSPGGFGGISEGPAPSVLAGPSVASSATMADSKRLLSITKADVLPKVLAGVGVLAVIGALAFLVSSLSSNGSDPVAAIKAGQGVAIVADGAEEDEGAGGAAGAAGASGEPADLSPAAPSAAAPSSSSEPPVAPGSSATTTAASTTSTAPVESTTSQVTTATTTTQTPSTTATTQRVTPPETTGTTRQVTPPDTTGTTETTQQVTPPDTTGTTRTTRTTEPPPPPPAPVIIRFTSRVPRESLLCRGGNETPFEAIWSTENTESVVLTMPNGTTHKGEPSASHRFCANSGQPIRLQADGPGGSTESKTTL